MKKQRRKLKKSEMILAAVLAAVLLFAVFLFIRWMNRDSGIPSYTAVELEDDELVYIVFDVGQGSAALISSGDMQIVIDGGTYLGGIDLAEKIRPYVSDGVVEYVIATHCQEDQDRKSVV